MNWSRGWHAFGAWTDGAGTQRINSSGDSTRPKHNLNQSCHKDKLHQKR